MRLSGCCQPGIGGHRGDGGVRRLAWSAPQGNFTLPPDWADLADELGAHPDDHMITRQRWGAFTGTSLHDHLQSRDVTQVVLTGIATSTGVESSARCAHEHGYHVVLATDAMTGLDPDVHRHSVEKIFPRLGEQAITRRSSPLSEP